MVGEPGPKPSLSAVIRCGGSQEVILAAESMPGPKWQTIVPPVRPSTSAGTNHDEIPGPVAMASQTCSGVPGTSTSTAIERLPDGSFFTLIMSPWNSVLAVAGARQ